MHSLRSSFILEFHGCSVDVADRVVSGDSFIPSQNDYDWLWHGIYFWEANPKRGLEFAQEVLGAPRRNAKPGKPAVVGAVIDLGFCLDLTTSTEIKEVELSYNAYIEIVRASKAAIPKNSRYGLRKNLDCAFINTLHEIRKSSNRPSVDTVKGVYLEGGPIYPESGLMTKTHIQICVRNQECIKGVFRVQKQHLG